MQDFRQQRIDANYDPDNARRMYEFTRLHQARQTRLPKRPFSIRFYLTELIALLSLCIIILAAALAMVLWGGA